MGDAEPASHTSANREDSDDSLNLKGSRNRIANDGPATRLLSKRRDVGSSKDIHSDTEPEPIEEFSEAIKKPAGRVREAVQHIEAREPPPRLLLNSSNPLSSIRSGSHKHKASLFFTEKEEQPVDTLTTRHNST